MRFEVEWREERLSVEIVSESSFWRLDCSEGSGRSGGQLIVVEDLRRGFIISLDFYDSPPPEQADY